MALSSPTSGAATFASFIGRKLPRLSRIALRSVGAVLPNLWLFHFLVQECGVRVATRATLGNGMRVKVFLGDMIGCHIWHSGWYEAHVIDALRPYLRADVYFFDIGANVGQYTLMAAPLVKEVHSFEPSPAVFRLLSYNVSHNGLSNVHLSQAAVSEGDGTATISESNIANIGRTSLRPARIPGGQDYAVRCVSLDDYVRSLPAVINPGKVVMKIDVEGAELLVLKGASHLLDSRPLLILEAIDELQRNFGHSVAELVTFLKNRDYMLHSLTEHGLETYNSDCPNILALPPT